MTLSISISDASFSNFVAEVLPHYELANMFLLLGGDAAKSTINYIGTGAAAVVASPIYGENFCTLSEINGFESPLVSSGSPFTHIIVATQAVANIGYCGNWLQSGGNAAQVNVLSKNANTMAVAVDSNIRASISTVGNGSGYKFMAGSHDGNIVKSYVGAGGVAVPVSSAYVGGSANKAKFRAGATGYGSSVFDAAAVLTFKTALTDQQVTNVYGYLQRLLLTRGVAVS